MRVGHGAPRIGFPMIGISAPKTKTRSRSSTTNKSTTDNTSKKDGGKIKLPNLVEMQQFSKWNKGFRYLLMVLDVFSKYGWIVPLKDKKGETVTQAFKTIFKEGRKPQYLWTDKGKEYYNKNIKELLEKNGITLYSTENEEKSSVCERWNRTIKTQMWKQFTVQGNTQYLDMLPKLVKEYNNTKHSSIKMTPTEASKKKNEGIVYFNLYGNMEQVSSKPKFKIGDKIRISKYKRKVFDKGYTPNWSEEIFKINKIQYTNPITYKLKDLNNEEIGGSFYEPELLKAEQEVFRIDKVIRRNYKKNLALVMETENSNENINTTDTAGHHGTGQNMVLAEVAQPQSRMETERSPYYLTLINDYTPMHPRTLSWEVSRENVIIEKIIGKGAFGQVAQGKVSQLQGREETVTVAIKMLKDNANESERKDLLSELEVMKKLKPHSHVITLLGCVTESDPLLVIIEYVPYGDLLGYLRKSRGLNDTYFKNPDVKPQTSLTSQQLIKFSWQVADGMRYLSSRNIIHRDLAARNVLVGERETCKVTDFGMARDVNQENIYEKKSEVPVPCSSCGGSPYPRTNSRKLADVLRLGYRMPKPSHVNEALYQIMLDCWREDPDDRPTFENLRDELKEMENQHQKYVNLRDYDKKLYENVEDLMF
ncbi:hypothetical protein ACROYT_G035157 [Oculina patagonica]